jgi:hypothetical protein
MEARDLKDHAAKRPSPRKKKAPVHPGSTREPKQRGIFHMRRTRLAMAPQAIRRQDRKRIILFVIGV